MTTSKESSFNDASTRDPMVEAAINIYADPCTDNCAAMASLADNGSTFISTSLDTGLLEAIVQGSLQRGGRDEPADLLGFGRGGPDKDRTIRCRDAWAILIPREIKPH